MTDLRTAAQQALEACEQRLPLKGQAAIIDELNNLRAALVEDAMQKFTDVNQELEAALAEHDKNLAGLKERKANWGIQAPRSPRDLQCKLAEETQERDRQRRGYEEQQLAALAEPVQEPVAWSHINGTSDTKWQPPQRKPLTREQAIALWADKSDGPSNSEIVLFARAIERAHGIV